MSDELVSSILAAAAQQPAAEPTTATEAPAELGLDEMKSRLAYLESESKKAYEARDAAKLQARDDATAKDKAERDRASKLAEAGEWKQAHDTLLNQYAAATPKLEAYDKMNSYVAAQVTRELAELPDEIAKSIPQSLDATEQLQLISALKRVTNTNAGPRLAPAAQQQVESADILSIADSSTRQEAIRNMTKDQRAALMKRIGSK